MNEPLKTQVHCNFMHAPMSCSYCIKTCQKLKRGEKVCPDFAKFLDENPESVKHALKTTSLPSLEFRRTFPELVAEVAGSKESPAAEPEARAAPAKAEDPRPALKPKPVPEQQKKPAPAPAPAPAPVPVAAAAPAPTPVPAVAPAPVAAPEPAPVIEEPSNEKENDMPRGIPNKPRQSRKATKAASAEPAAEPAPRRSARRKSAGVVNGAVIFVETEKDSGVFKLLDANTTAIDLLIASKGGRTILATTAREL